MLTIVLATIPYLGQLIDKHSIIVFFRWCFRSLFFYNHGVLFDVDQ